MITTARIYLFGALALAVMIGISVFRQLHAAPKPPAMQSLATQPATSAPATAASALAAADELTLKREELSAHPDDLALQERVAFLLISQPKPSADDISEATALVENACRKSQFKERKYIETLGKVYAVAGRYDRAVKVGEIVRLLAENAHDEDAVKAADLRLEVYRSMLLQQQIEADLKKNATQPATRKN